MQALTDKEKQSQLIAKAKREISHSNPTGIIADCVEKMCFHWNYACVVSDQIDAAKLRPPGRDNLREALRRIDELLPKLRRAWDIFYGTIDPETVETEIVGIIEDDFSEIFRQGIRNLLNVVNDYERALGKLHMSILREQNPEAKQRFIEEKAKLELQVGEKIRFLNSVNASYQSYVLTMKSMVDE
jgi:hypothetical protein